MKYTNLIGSNMSKKINILLILLVSTAAIFFGACSKTDSSSKNTVTYNLVIGPKTIDPQLSTSISATKIDTQCMEGLIILGQKSGEVLPGAAEKWDVSKDGLTWTFHLRQNAKWSNGDPITANDFNFGLKRALKPNSAAQNAYILYDIKNAKAYNQGKIKDYSKVGIKVVDKDTIQIVLAHPVTYFAQLISSTIAFPLNEKFYNQVKDQYTLSADKMLYNGPYVLKNYIPNGKYEFEKNPNYWNADNIKIDKLSFLIVGNYNTAADMFKDKGLDITSITGNQIPQFKNTKAFKTVQTGGLDYLEFNVKNKFFSNVNIRKAVGMAIDRRIFCKDILKDGSSPAYGFVPPGISGGKIDGKLITYRKRFGYNLFSYNIPEAKRLYAKGLKELNYKGKVSVKLLCGNTSGSLRNTQFLQEQLYKNLGMSVELEPNTFQSQLSKMSQENFDFVYTEWLPDYDDPDTYLNIWVKGGGNNYTQWSNKQFDAYIKTAAESPDDNIRMNAMYKAEELLMKEMPVTPIIYRVEPMLVQPKLKGVVLVGLGTTLSFDWAYVEK